MSIGEELLLFWKRQSGLNLCPPVQPSSIEIFENRAHVFLPEDFADYLLHADGFNQAAGYQDDEGYNFWPLSRIASLSDFDGGTFFADGFADFYIFADFLDLCWAYAIRLASSKAGTREIAIVGTSNGRPQVIARDFAEFARLYLARDLRLQPV